jgi:hypothetical protein
LNASISRFKYPSPGSENLNEDSSICTCWVELGSKRRVKLCIVDVAWDPIEVLWEFNMGNVSRPPPSMSALVRGPPSMFTWCPLRISCTRRSFRLIRRGFPSARHFSTFYFLLLRRIPSKFYGNLTLETSPALIPSIRFPPKAGDCVRLSSASSAVDLEASAVVY